EWLRQLSEVQLQAMTATSKTGAVLTGVKGGLQDAHLLHTPPFDLLEALPDNVGHLGAFSPG
uniref:Uncharacterized protein n=1 Tax=Sparus aurata TaxID=8175 RepID=A0A671UX83_SPAAU